MIANFISGLFAGVWFYLVLFSVGAIVGIGAWVTGKFTGVLGAAAFGAVALVAAYVSGVANTVSSQQDAAKIAQLEAEKKALQTSIALANASKKELEQAMAEAADTAEQNAATLAELENAIRNHGEGCGISDEEMDLINKLR